MGTDSSEPAPIQGPGMITVIRRLGNGTNLCEMWVIDGVQWVEEMDTSVSVTCYVGRTNFLANLRRVPPKDETVVKDSVELQDVPEGVRQEFEEQAGRVARGVGND